MVNKPGDEAAKRGKKAGAVDRSLMEVLHEETFSSASLSPWKSLKRNLTSFMRRKEQTILEIRSPLADSELESFRAETLVSFDAGTVIPWTAVPNEESLAQAKGKDLLRVVSGLAGHSNLSREQSNLISRFKNSLVIRSRLLTQTEIILNIVNHGIRSYLHTLEKLAQITTNKKINKKIAEYLKAISEPEVVAHGAQFRKDFDACQTHEELDRLMVRYVLNSMSTIKSYKELHIIRALKQLLQSYAKEPQNLQKILNKYLGSYGEANIKNKLSQLLVTSTSDAEILKKIGKERDLQALLAAVGKSKSQPQSGQHAEKLSQLLKSFVDPHSRVGFGEFKASLNLFSPLLVSKICSVAKDSLSKELQKEVSRTLAASGDATQHLQDLDRLLTNPRYNEAQVTLYGYPPQLIYDKIHSVDGRSPNAENLLRHILSNAQVPPRLFLLVTEAKRELVKAGKKTTESCHQQLVKLQGRIKNRETLQLRSELINLFKAHGTVNFAVSEERVSVNGYDIATMIAEFYNIPNRSTIDLPADIISDIRDLLKDLIDQERTRQLKQMG
jgi:hypothetical protein